MTASSDPIVEALVAGFRDLATNERSNAYAERDHTLPAFVRSFLILHTLPATEKWVIEEARHMPRLYACHQGRPCRVVVVSTMGDVGIAYKDVETGYSERLSIYDLTDYSEKAHPWPEPPPNPEMSAGLGVSSLSQSPFPNRKQRRAMRSRNGSIRP